MIGVFAAGAVAGFFLLGATLWAYERWAWAVVKDALTWAAS